MSAKPTKQSDGKRYSLILKLFQFRLGTFLWLFLLLGVFLIWQKDRSNLEARIGRLESRFAGSLSKGYGAIQLTGKPNVLAMADNPKAWCPAGMDGQEWIWLDFGRNILASGVDVYESWCPGSIVSVAAVDWWGTENVLWSGTTAPPLAGKTTVAFDRIVKTRRLKIYLDGSQSQGWNEIDAVGLIDRNSTVHWPTRAKTSSCWGGATTDSANPNGTRFGANGYQFSGIQVLR